MRLDCFHLLQIEREKPRLADIEKFFITHFKIDYGWLGEVGWRSVGER